MFSTDSFSYFKEKVAKASASVTSGVSSVTNTEASEKLSGMFSNVMKVMDPTVSCLGIRDRDRRFEILAS